MFKPHIRIYLSAFLIDLAVMATMVVLPFFIFHQLNGNEATSGMVGGAQAAVYAIVCLFSASFVTKAKNGLSWAVFGVAFYMVASCAMPFFRNIWICGALVSIAMSGMALVWPALHSWVGAEPDVVVRAKRMGWFNISWSFGFAVSPLLAGPLYDIDYRLPFVLLFAVCAVALVLLRSMPHEKAYFGVASQEDREARAEHDRASERLLYASWTATLVANALIGVTRTVYPKRVDDLVASGQLRLLFEDAPAAILASDAATKYSWLAFALSLTTALVFLVMGNTRGWHHRFGYIAVLQLLSGGAFWVLGTTRSLVVMILAFIVVGALTGVTFFSSVFYSMADPALKHRRAAINEFVVGAGGVVGSFSVGYLAKLYGMTIPLQFTLLFVVAAVALQFLMIRIGARRLRDSSS